MQIEGWTPVRLSAASATPAEWSFAVMEKSEKRKAKSKKKEFVMADIGYIG